MINIKTNIKTKNLFRLKRGGDSSGFVFAKVAERERKGVK